MAYNFEYVKDGNGNVTDILVNGEPVKPASRNAFLKAQKTTFFRLYEEDGIFVSPYNGGRFELNGLELTLVDWTYTWQNRYNRWQERMTGNLKDFTQTPVQTFDRIREFILDLNSETYFDLID